MKLNVITVKHSSLANFGRKVRNPLPHIAAFAPQLYLRAILLIKINAHRISASSSVAPSGEDVGRMPKFALYVI
jgi:hypothetical protein